MSWLLLAVLGVAAVLATIATFVLEIANAVTSRTTTTTVQTAAAVAAALEGAVLGLLAVFFIMSLRHSTYYGQNKLGSVWFPAGLVAIVLATAASIVVLVVLGKETENVPILGGAEMSYLVGDAVTVGIAFTLQMVFVVVYFMGSRLAGDDRAHSLHTEGGRFTPQMRVKSIAYSKTLAGSYEPKERLPVDYQSPPGSSSGRSMAETMSSIRSSLSHKIRPVDSRTRLLSVRSTRSVRSTGSRTGRRPPSFDSLAPAEQGFDSWDTSAVDPQNRQVIDTSLPAAGAPRFLGGLETIPASPTVSRSPSPGYALDLEPPPKRNVRRSRSYSPVPRPPPAMTPDGSTSELNIHPLFRTDSPTPPPAATPGTSIIAAPDVARTRTVSAKSLNRMRSGSLPASSSPLSAHGSLESLKSSKAPSPTGERLSPLATELVEERQMTPPLPEWILNAGCRSSLAEYHSRKARDSKADSGLDLAQ
ncbi:uncharacterized protein JN550_012755 [Neoarthrinium moseri]|uniref:uncharacterized protein n=1 Tax=Neoarthrinium moseri TaxID=1658444 RepID=UPI001FDB09F1|nr:uncharacterized protein JN550_012755 [Neoarthrinium moseri]KAI1858305.1 hypothetical protein JN550_012755 [Neoarthrinium moseri]